MVTGAVKGPLGEQPWPKATLPTASKIRANLMSLCITLKVA